MAENSYPFYGVTTSENEFSAWVAALVGSGVISGLAVAAGSGMSVDVAAGAALARGRYYENTATKNVAVTAAPVSGTRKDAIILKVDFTTKTIVVTKKDGTTAGGGTLPTLQQDNSVWEIKLAEVTVAAGTISITGGMLAATASTLPVQVYSFAAVNDRPAPSESFALGLDVTTKIPYIWSSGAWSTLKVAVADLSGTLPIAQGGTGAVTAAAARTALDVAKASDAASLTGGTLDSARLPTVPISKGGTGATTKTLAREALGIFVQSAPMTGANAVGDIRLW
jgi:hypothetical protein